MKLELKHLTPYPPTLQIMWEGVVCSLEGFDYHNNSIILERVNCSLEVIKPILRPLKEYKNYEDILDEFSVYSEEKFINSFFLDIGRSLNCLDSVDYSLALLMFKYHLDLFGLIDQGLAININTL